MVVAKIFGLIRRHKLIFIFFAVLVFITLYVALNGIGLWSLEQQGGDDCQNYGGDSGTKINGVGGAWTTKGTKAYNTAKAIFDYLTKKDGFSGAGAAGAVACAFRESTFNPKAGNTDGSVVGIFQWSGWSNTTNGSRIHSGGIIKSALDLTVSKELQLTDYELHHNYSHARLAVGKAGNPQKAAEQWSVLYEGVPLSDPQTKLSLIHSVADKAYRMFGGSRIKSKNSLLGGAAKGAANASSDGDDSCDDGGDGGAVHGDIAKTAERYIGWFTYKQAHGESYIGSVKHPNKHGVTDCSGFVWFVLAKAGYKIPADMGWYTRTMADDAMGSHHWLYKIPASQTRTGDIIIANVGSGSSDDGHTAILLEKYHGASTRIIQEGGTGGNGPVNKGRVGQSFGSRLLGGQVIFARAIKKK